MADAQGPGLAEGSRAIHERFEDLESLVAAVDGSKRFRVVGQPDRLRRVQRAPTLMQLTRVLEESNRCGEPAAHQLELALTPRDGDRQPSRRDGVVEQGSRLVEVAFSQADPR